MNKRTLSLAALTLLDVPPPTGADCGQNRFTHVGLRLLPPHRPTRTTTCWAIPGRPGDARRVDGNWHPRVGRGDRPPDPRVYPRRSAAAFYGDRRVLAPDRC